MEQEIGNISIALIRKLNPAMKGIGNDFIMDSTEYYIPDVNSIFKYPLRLDGIIIAVRKQGSATININLREYNTTKNDLILCALFFFTLCLANRACIKPKCSSSHPIF